MDESLWTCSRCGNMNPVALTACPRCKAPKAGSVQAGNNNINQLLASARMAGEVILVSSRSRLHASWVCQVTPQVVIGHLQGIFVQNGMTIVSEREYYGREIVVDQGSQMAIRTAGSLLISPGEFPKRAVIHLNEVPGGVAFDVIIGETFGFGFLDPYTKGKYEEYFRGWIGMLMQVFPALPPGAGGVVLP